MEAILSWLAPIVSTIITAYATTLIARGERKREEKRQTDAERWEDVTKRLDDQDERISIILQAQCSQIRSDVIHKCHRYLDDLGRASSEEKEALKAEHDEYSAVCKANGILNNFVDLMVQRVMELPEREV